MTEDEARQKWCPSVREIAAMSNYELPSNTVMYNPSTQVAGNRLPDGNMSKCIASDCMAWRWEDGPMDDELHGYCGLAGKP